MGRNKWSNLSLQHVVVAGLFLTAWCAMNVMEASLSSLESAPVGVENAEPPNTNGRLPSTLQGDSSHATRKNNRMTGSAGSERKRIHRNGQDHASLNTRMKPASRKTVETSIAETNAFWERRALKEKSGPKSPKAPKSSKGDKRRRMTAAEKETELFWERRILKEKSGPKSPKAPKSSKGDKRGRRKATEMENFVKENVFWELK